MNPTSDFPMLFSDTAAAFDGSFQAYHPFPPAAERKHYEALPDELRKELIHAGEARLHCTYPSIRATDFMDFSRTGNRSRYEAVYFLRRNMLNDLILAECAEHQGRFLDNIINGIYTICEESAWQLPPHNSYFRDQPQHPLPDVTRPLLDLFACETGALLACAAHLLKRELDAVSPFIISSIEEALLRRIIRPYLNFHFWWMGQGSEPMCNWTVWCTQNVLLTAFLTPWSDAARSNLALNTIVQKAAESCDCFLKDYGEDGCCDEGAQYYRHGGLCLYGAMSILNTVTRNAFSSLFHLDKIRNIAMYILNVHVHDKYYFNFADCSPVAGRAGVREFLFGKETGQEELCLFAAKDFQAASDRLVMDEVNGSSLFYRMLTVFHYRELMNYNTASHLPRKNLYYPSVGLFLVHSSSMDLAVKAGDNDDSHNHNDTGSLTLYKDGQPVLVDIGVETYTGKTFSAERYEIWTMQSGYHNLPTISGKDQSAGADYRATQVTANPLGDTPSISMELGVAYPLTQLSYVREVLLDKQKNRVVLTDRTNAADVICNFITYEKPMPLSGTPDLSAEASPTRKAAGYPTGEVSSSHGALLHESAARSLQVGNAVLCWQGASLLAVETLPITDARLQTAWDHDLYRIRLRMQPEKDACFHMIIA